MSVLDDSIYELREQFSAHLRGLTNVLAQLDTIIEQRSTTAEDDLVDWQATQLENDEVADTEDDPFSRMARAQAKEELEKSNAADTTKS